MIQFHIFAAGLIVFVLNCTGCASPPSEAISSRNPDHSQSIYSSRSGPDSRITTAKIIVPSSERVIDVIGEFYIPSNEEWVFKSDVVIRATAQLVIDGVLRCEPPTSPDQPAPSITLVSHTGIVIRGEVRPTSGFDGVVPGEAGGDAGKLTLAAPIIVSRLPFQGARGGIGAPGGNGGAGGSLEVYGSTIGPFNQAPDTSVSEVRAGDGGIGGPARYFEAYPEALRAGDGGDGGSAKGGPFMLADWDGPIPEVDE